MNRVIFITGGARSGKSSFALKKAEELPGRKIYIATAEPLDEEMRQRILRHQKERSSEWRTIEEPLKIAELIGSAPGDVVLLDCLTLWLSNLMRKEEEEGIDNSITNLLRALERFKELSPSGPQSSTLFIVSNEVGMGIVPQNKMAREFRDLSGILNQRVAEIAQEVYLLVSGIPLKIKG